MTTYNGKLLSIGNDAKTVKGEKYGYKTGIFYGAPASISGVNVCKFSTGPCRAACLYSAGRGVQRNVQKARIARMQFFNENPTDFVNQLNDEIAKLEASAKRAGLIPAVRLNGTSDILWENYDIFGQHPTCQFYDYTKYPAALRQNRPANYHLTYSFTGEPISAEFSKLWVQEGVNTAVVFRGALPSELAAAGFEFLGRRVIDGDASDLRFNDEAGVIVGLKAKGEARGGISSFVQDVSLEALDHARNTARVCFAAAALA